MTNKFDAIKELIENTQFVVFAYWKDGELMGFRSDTFGTLNKTRPKIYGYSKEQIEIVLESTRQLLSNVGTSCFSMIFQKDSEPIQHISNQEKEIRSWGEFELRVHPFIGYTWDSIDNCISYPDEIFIDIEVKNLRDAIEVYKFKVVDNEN